MSNISPPDPGSHGQEPHLAGKSPQSPPDRVKNAVLRVFASFQATLKDFFPKARLDSAKVEAVIEAANRGHLEVIQGLLANGTISIPDRGQAAISAARGGHLKVIQELLGNGAYIRDKDRGRAVIDAARGGHFGVIQELLAGGASIDRESRGEAVVLAAGHGHLEVVQALLANGATIPRIERDDAVLRAAWGGYPQVIQALLANASIGIDSLGSALITAASRGDHEVIQALLANGAAIRETDRDLAVFRASGPNAESIRISLMQARVFVSERNLFQFLNEPASRGTLKDALVKWSLELKEDFPDAELFSTLDGTASNDFKVFLNRLRETADYKEANPTGKKDFARRLKEIVVSMSTIEDFRDPAIGVISEALASCSDRLTVCLNRLEMLQKTRGKDKPQTNLGKAFLALQIFRHEMLTEKVNKLHTEIYAGRPTIRGEWMETMLFAENALREILKLPIDSRVMSYPACSRIKKGDIPQVSADILELTDTDEKVIKTLANRCPFWQDHLRSEKSDEYDKLMTDRMEKQDYKDADEDEKKVLLDIAFKEKYENDTVEWYRKEGDDLRKML